MLCFIVQLTWLTDKYILKLSPWFLSEKYLALNKWKPNLDIIHCISVHCFGFFVEGKYRIVQQECKFVQICHEIGK